MFYKNNSELNFVLFGLFAHDAIRQKRKMMLYLVSVPSEIYRDLMLFYSGICPLPKM